MQNVAGLSRQPAMRHDGLKLLKFRLQLLVDQQECLYCASKIAVAPGDDFVDRGFIWSGSHRKPSQCSHRMG